MSKRPALTCREELVSNRTVVASCPRSQGVKIFCFPVASGKSLRVAEDYRETKREQVQVKETQTKHGGMNHSVGMGEHIGCQSNVCRGVVVQTETRSYLWQDSIYHRRV